MASNPVGYAPADIADAYGFPTNGGAGATIAIVDAYGSPTIQSDLNYFCTAYGIPETQITILSPSTSTSTGGGGTHGHKGHSHQAANAGWALETSLDVEWAHAMAPGAKIILSVASSASMTDLVNAIDAALAKSPNVVSMSWGGSEWSGESTYDTSLFDAPGVMFTASSGDSGSGAEWPAVSPYVTGVGGTTLSLASSGWTETAWSGSGGGPSLYETDPSYQASWNGGTARTTPDVALDANPNTGVAVYDSTKYEGVAGWFQIGGTSVGAPIWAALLAQTGASDGANAKLYGVVTPQVVSPDYNDITSGSNGAYYAGTGYDMVTGLGSPNASTLISDLP